MKEQEESLRIVTEKLGLKKQIISSDMARSAVDEAMKNILLPQIEKEKLVEQLQVVRKHRYFENILKPLYTYISKQSKTKVRDLERFIEFIQTNKEAKDLDLPQLPNDSANRGCDKISRSKF